MSKKARKPDNMYWLVVFDAPEEPGEVRDLICGVTGLHPPDAMAWIARAPGVVRQPLAEGEVRALLDGLYGQGVAAEAWRVDALPKLNPAQLGPPGRLPGGRVPGPGPARGAGALWVPWDHIELVADGRIGPEDEYLDIEPPGWVESTATG